MYKLDFMKFMIKSNKIIYSFIEKFTCNFKKYIFNTTVIIIYTYCVKKWKPFMTK